MAPLFIFGKIASMGADDKKVLLKEVPLPEFFRERVQTAMAKQRLAASALAEFYLVNLLQEFRKTEKLFEQRGSQMAERPLALLLAEAVEGDLQTRIRRLKQLGDVSLYTAGFFGERIKHKPVDINYYIRMGGGAYSNLAGILSNQKTFAELYGELSQLFPSLVDVLADVAVSGHWQTNADLLKLYERWLATGSESLEKLLNEEGIQTQDKGLLNKIQ